MKRKGKGFLLLLALAVVALLGVTSCQTAPVKTDYSGAGLKGPGRSVMDWPDGVTKYIPNECYNGYTIWCSLGGDGTVNLMDMKGNVVHSWKTHYPPGMYGRLLENGNLLYEGRTGMGYGGSSHHMSGKGGVILEMDWEGNIVNKVYAPPAHHDIDKLPNGNYLAILWEPLSKEKRSLVRGGVPGTEFPDGWIFEEIIAEIDPKGNTVWQWRASDHLKFEDFPVCPENDRLEWLHANSVDYLPADNPITKTESIMVSLRHPSACIIFEKATGNLQWRYGGCKEGEWGRLGAQHDFQLIQKGLPGEGNILIFDNGMNLPSVPESGLYWGIAHSRILEIAPKSMKVVWRYEHTERDWKFPIQPMWKFDAPFISGCQRLPNGNTFIDDGPVGRLFEVTEKGEIVWEFINPDHKAIFRSYRYGPDYPGLAGKGLPKPF